LVLVHPATALGRGAALVLLALIASPARALDFASCAEPRHEGFDCATLPVPIDRDGMVPGTIDLHVERQRGKDGLPVVVSVAGGPGYSSTAYRPKDDLEDLEELGYAVQLVVVDQRGTGLSGALESVAPACRTLDSRRALRDCDEALGPAGAFYRTADSVLDLEAVRAALGVERLIVLGVSYGTFLAAEYARRFPDRAQALVLDSPVGPEGGEPLEVTSAHATARVLNALCRDGACAQITRDPAADTAALVRRLTRRPLRMRVRVPGKPRERVELRGADLMHLLVAGDFYPQLRAMYPAAVRAALGGDVAPVLRLSWLASRADAVDALGTGLTRAAGDGRDVSRALLFATSCSDTRYPWDPSAGPRRRKRVMAAYARTFRRAQLFPFDRRSLLDSVSCLEWPRSPVPGAILGGRLPDVPALILVGEADLRTPVEDATALMEGTARATTVVVPNMGHAVYDQQACARTATASFLKGTPLDRACDTVKPTVSVQPRLAKSLDDLPEANGLGAVAGRTLTAVRRTVIDAVLASFVVNGGVSGLRGGDILCPRDCRSDDRQLTLERASLVRGVGVSGTIMLASRSLTASVTVAGSKAASGVLEFHADGAVTGRLGGRDVSVAADPAGEIPRLGMLGRGVPTIVRLPRFGR